MTGKIKLVHSGGNSVSVAVPTNAPSASEVEFKLPQSDGSSGQALVTDASGNLSFASVAGGKILQVLTNSTRDGVGSLSLSSALTFYEIPNQNLTITPSATSSKILISFHQMGETSNGSNQYYMALKRAISGGSTTTITAPSVGNRPGILTAPLKTYEDVNRSTTPEFTICAGYLDSPSTTSAITYTVQIACQSASTTYYYNRTLEDGNYDSRERGLSWITVQEVAA